MIQLSGRPGCLLIQTQPVAQVACAIGVTGSRVAQRWRGADAGNRPCAIEQPAFDDSQRAIEGLAPVIVEEIVAQIKTINGAGVAIWLMATTSRTGRFMHESTDNC